MTRRLRSDPTMPRHSIIAVLCSRSCGASRRRSYGRAQRLAPDYADAHWNEALLRLLIGDFAAGLAKYEWRWQRANFTSPPRNFPQPQWDGTDHLEGKTILLHGEQGFGDVIQFCRYVPQVKARG